MVLLNSDVFQVFGFCLLWFLSNVFGFLVGPSEAQKQTNDITGRYDALADKLADRQKELGKMKDLMKGMNDQTDKLQPLLDWVEDVREQLRKQSPIGDAIAPVTAQLEEQRVRSVLWHQEMRLFCVSLHDL